MKYCKGHPFSKLENSLLHSLFSRRDITEFKFTFKIPHSAYVVGEDIPFELEVDNPSSSHRIERMTLLIIQKVHYNTTLKWGNLKQKIVSKKERTQDMASPNGSNNNDKWISKLKIPKSVNCNQTVGLIEISYSIKV
jgi:hypothetical protein